MSFKKTLLASTLLATSLIGLSAEANAQTNRRRPVDATPAAEPAPVRASASEVAALQSRIDTLQQQLADLNIELKNRLTTTEKKVNEAPQWTFSNGRPTISSPDGAFTMNFTGRIHFDVGDYARQEFDGPGNLSEADRDLSAGTNARRLRFGLGGKVARDWEYMLEFNAGGSGNGDGPTNVYQAWLAYTTPTEIPVRVQAGYFKPIITLDDATSSNNITFMERASAANLTTGLVGGDARATFQLSSYGTNWSLFGGISGNVATDEPFEDDEQLNVFARGVLTPLKDTSDAARPTILHLGANYGYVVHPAENATVPGTAARTTVRLRDRPELRLDGSRLIDTGDLAVEDATIYGGELGFQHGPLQLQGEYTYYETNGQALVGAPIAPDYTFNAWYAQASYVLTGESRAYSQSSGSWGTVRPAAPFTFGGGTGAWELAVRYSKTDLNDSDRGFTVRGGEQDIWTFGVNWYVNNNVRFMANYLSIDVERNNALNQPIGREVDAYGLRTQISF